MTTEKQRIKIAELDGWVRDNVCGVWRKNGEVAYCDGRSLHYKQLPDYQNDLNSIRKAILSLPLEKQIFFVPNLKKVLMTEEGVSEFDIVTASAENLCEAFLKTFGSVEKT
jgi:hypothetical protein